MEVKKLFFVVCLLSGTGLMAQKKQLSEAALQRAQKKEERREKINQLIKQEEEGALIFNKQNAFSINLNTDGWGVKFEKGKYKSITSTNLWWLEFGERKHPKEERIPTLSSSGGFILISNYIYGKQNNFYYLNLGFGQQKLIGGKGNKNGIAVSAIYGAGLSAGLLKPYYLDVQNQQTGERTQIKYDGTNEATFLDPNVILGRGGLFKGFGEMKFVPGAHAKLALRFDYGRYNELLSAIDVGVNASFYSQKMPILLLNPEKNFFFNAYAAFTFGRRK